MLAIHQLSKRYKNNIWAVQDFDLSIRANELVAIAGPNGSGKTSIINCLLSIIDPTSGEVHLDGHPNDSHEFKQRIAYVPDELILPEALTGSEYLDFVTSMYEHANAEKRKNLIELFDMKAALNEPIETYSHGMKKKTQLIAAFMLKSSVVIMDEPFRGLDVEAIIMTKKLMSKYVEKDGSILLSTHDLMAAENMCDRIAILSKGKKVAEGTVADLKKEHGCANLEEVFMKVSMLSDRSARFEKIIENF
ncbi:ABC transporter ATP-binding protein [Desmospora profundinema]|uniref:ABC-2 type transport system ATP-binding protein n=1 Tax=Desmospora profundinema TaxID=1571184 RepID=A0ABU1IN62_9BACL|nr:ABC transporter ATP-binding protein [Desmospora profundinema]MDR6226131.1 ABC-2 type transport system ATP-binding protein [Desmospora profundinema]